MSPLDATYKSRPHWTDIIISREIFGAYEYICQDDPCCVEELGLIHFSMWRRIFHGNKQAARAYECILSERLHSLNISIDLIGEINALCLSAVEDAIQLNSKNIHNNSAIETNYSNKYILDVYLLQLQDAKASNLEDSFEAMFEFSWAYSSTTDSRLVA